MKIKKELFQDIAGVEYLENEDMSKYSTMKLAGVGNVFIVRTVDALQKLLRKLFAEKVEYRVLGLGANQILPPTSTSVYIKLLLPFQKEILDKFSEVYTLPASVTLNVLTTAAIKHGLKGWDYFTGIPATLGGAVAMNAGTELGEIGSLIKSVEIVNKEGKLRTENLTEKSFLYRKNLFLKSGDVLVSVSISNKGIDNNLGDKIKSYLEKRNETQPLWEKTCGCVFKNYSLNVKAGRSLDLLGLKGFKIGNMRVSPVHANFLENIGNGNAQDLKTLIDFIQHEVYLYYGIKFELEVKFD